MYEILLFHLASNLQQKVFELDEFRLGYESTDVRIVFIACRWLASL
mgnify:CR=1 FL=1